MKEFGVNCDEEDINFSLGRSPNEKMSYIEKKHNIIIDEEKAIARYAELNSKSFPLAKTLLLMM